MASLMYPRRGDIYWVNLDPTIGSEIAKTRPALIISNDIGNQYSSRVIVAPITSRGLDRIYPFEAMLAGGETGLAQPSKALLDQIRTLDKRRLAGRIGAISTEQLQEVNRAIRLSLAL